jgi:rhomboid protease GluP
MDGDINYAKYSVAELLDILGHIDARRHPLNFDNLKAELAAHGYTVTETTSGAWRPVSSTERAAKSEPTQSAFECPARLSPARGLISWLEPARNDFRLVGCGAVSIDQSTVVVSGRRFGLALGLPLKRKVELRRADIVNVESEAKVVRFEYRTATKKHKSMTLFLDDVPSAHCVASLLPSQRAEGFQPQLPTAMRFERGLQPRAPATIALIVFNTLVFLATLIGGAKPMDPSGAVQIAWGSNFGPYTLAGDWWRLLTATVLHFGVVHLAINMWALGALGGLAERLYGTASYLVIYFVSGVAGNLTSVGWHAGVNGAGASGAILGICGALTIELARRRRELPVQITAGLHKSMLVFVGCILAATLAGQRIDNASHVGGLVIGLLLGAFLADPPPLQDETPVPTAKRIAAALTLSLLLLGGGGVLLALRGPVGLDGPGLYWYTLRWFSKTEPHLASRQTELWTLVRHNSLDDEQFARQLETEILPQWQEADRRFSNIQLASDSPLRQPLSDLREFVHSRRNAYGLCVAGARVHDTAMIKACVEELARGDTFISSRMRSPSDY